MSAPAWHAFTEGRPRQMATTALAKLGWRCTDPKRDWWVDPQEAGATHCWAVALLIERQRHGAPIETFEPFFDEGDSPSICGPSGMGMVKRGPGRPRIPDEFLRRRRRPYTPVALRRLGQQPAEIEAFDPKPGEPGEAEGGTAPPQIPVWLDWAPFHFEKLPALITL